MDQSKRRIRARISRLQQRPKRTQRKKINDDVPTILKGYVDGETQRGEMERFYVKAEPKRTGNSGPDGSAGFIGMEKLIYQLASDRLTARTEEQRVWKQRGLIKAELGADKWSGLQRRRGLTGQRWLLMGC